LIKALLFNDTSMAGHHGCTLVKRQISAFADLNGIMIEKSLPSNIPLNRQHVQNIDAIIINGEGSLHSSSKSALAIADVLNWCHENGLPCFLINSIFQNNNDYIEHSISLANQVYVRDLASLQTLRSTNIPAHYVPDITLSWSPDNARQSNNEITVTDSTLKGLDQALFQWSDKYDCVRYLPLKARPARNSTATLNNLPKVLKFLAKRHLISLFTSRFYSSRYRNSIPEFEPFIDKLSESQLILAGRFHAICLAVDLEVPFCALSSNSWKVENLLKELGLENRLVTLDDIQSSSPQNLLNNFNTFSQDELESMRSFKNRTRTNAMNMFSGIAKTLEHFQDVS